MAGVNATPSGLEGEARLKEYWAHGPGRQKWIDSPHPYATLHALLSKYVSGRMLDGLTANIFRLATGHYPGQRKDGERL
jgi:hypothetical protein